MKHRVRLFAVVVFLGSLCQGMADAQQPGGIAGTIVDPNGNAITGYTDGIVTMRDALTGTVFRADIEPDGTFELVGLPAGTYEFAVPLIGAMYRPYRQDNVVIAAEQTLTMTVSIEWGMNLGTFGDDPFMLAKDMARSGEKLAGQPTPRTPDGKPDFSGVWAPAFRPDAPPAPLPLQPWAAEMLKTLQATGGPDAQNPGAYCLPQAAVPFLAPFPWKLVQTPTLIVHLIEFFTPGFRQIFMDGRPHPAPEDWNPSWHGHSVGRWEGDTLVVDTVGYNEITPGFGIHTEKLHTVERIRRPDMTRLEIEITGEDPDAYTGPWTISVQASLAPEHEILEFVCPENNKDAITFGGLGWKGRP